MVYPERRPFFLENASIFTMPEELFFSRRIVDPQFGAKLTGSIGRWSVGALVADDRAPGEILMPGETGHGDRAMDAVFRVEREFAHQSHVGCFSANEIWMTRGIASVPSIFAILRRTTGCSPARRQPPSRTLAWAVI